MHRIEHISRPKLNEFGRHHGLRLPDGRVIHKTPEGVQVVSFREFSAGKEVRVEDTVTGEREIKRTLERLRQEHELQIPYDLIMSNCETYVRGAIGQPKVSWQVLIIGALAIGIAYGLIANNGKHA